MHPKKLHLTNLPVKEPSILPSPNPNHHRPQPPKRFSTNPNISPLRRSHSDSKLLQPNRTPTFPDLPILPTRPLRQPYNESIANTFGKQLVHGVNDASTCILISLGHHLGLFATMSRLSPTPHTAHSIANSAGNINPRYVAEWLSSMTCAGIIDQAICRDQQAVIVKVYVLPPEHAHFLTWSGQSDNNLALLAQHISILGRLENDIVECFRTGNGLEPHYFKHFESVSALDMSQTIEGRFEEIVDRVDGLQGMLQDGCSVLCIGGSGHRVYLDIARKHPNSWFTCYEARVEKARGGKGRRGDRGRVRNMHVKGVEGGVYKMKERASYDVALMFDSACVRNSGYQHESFGAIERSLRPGAALILLEGRMYGGESEDRKHRMGRLLYSMSTMYSLPASLFSDRSGRDVRVAWGYAYARRMLVESGFVDVEVHALAEDEKNCLLIARSGQV